MGKNIFETGRPELTRDLVVGISRWDVYPIAKAIRPACNRYLPLRRKLVPTMKISQFEKSTYSAEGDASAGSQAAGFDRCASAAERKEKCSRKVRKSQRRQPCITIQTVRAHWRDRIHLERRKTRVAFCVAYITKELGNECVLPALADTALHCSPT